MLTPTDALRGTLRIMLIAAATATLGASAQTPTPKHCFKFSDTSERTITGYEVYDQSCQMDVVIPSSVDTIEQKAFYEIGLTSIVIPNSVQVIGNEAFANNQLTSVEIPNSVQKIGYRAFSRNQLTSVVISNSVKACLTATLDGFGIGFLPEGLVAPAVASGALVQVLDDWCLTFPGLHLYYPSRRQLSPAFRVILDALRHPGRAGSAVGKP